MRIKMSKNNQRELTTLEQEFIKNKKELYGEKVIVNENTVIVKSIYPSEVGIAKCNPNDQFDIKIGYEVAKLDLKNKEYYESLKYIDSKKLELEKKFKKEIDKLNQRRNKYKKEISRNKHKMNTMSKSKENK